MVTFSSWEFVSSLLPEGHLLANIIAGGLYSSCRTRSDLFLSPIYSIFLSVILYHNCNILLNIYYMLFRF
jgi:hypothetical protein